MLLLVKLDCLMVPTLPSPWSHHLGEWQRSIWCRASAWAWGCVSPSPMPSTILMAKQGTVPHCSMNQQPFCSTIIGFRSFLVFKEWVPLVCGDESCMRIYRHIEDMGFWFLVFGSTDYIEILGLVCVRSTVTEDWKQRDSSDCLLLKVIK